MKNNILRLSIQTIAFSTLLASCVNYSHSYRLVDDASKEDRTIEVNDNYVVDLEIDFKSKIKASSAFKHNGVGQVQKAKKDAYYQAITQNGIDILVNPIYQVKTVKGLFGSKSTADVTGYKAMYGKVTELEAGNGGSGANGSSLAISEEDQLFEMRFENLKKLSTINDIAHEEKSVYAVDTRQGCCDGSASKGADGFGNLHLLETTKNKKSLVEQYKKIIDEEKASRSSIEKSLFNFIKKK